MTEKQHIRLKADRIAGLGCLHCNDWITYPKTLCDCDDYCGSLGCRFKGEAEA